MQYLGNQTRPDKGLDHTVFQLGQNFYPIQVESDLMSAMQTKHWHQSYRDQTGYIEGPPYAVEHATNRTPRGTWYIDHLLQVEKAHVGRTPIHRRWSCEGVEHIDCNWKTTSGLPGLPTQSHCPWCSCYVAEVRQPRKPKNIQSFLALSADISLLLPGPNKELFKRICDLNPDMAEPISESPGSVSSKEGVSVELRRYLKYSPDGLVSSRGQQNPILISHNFHGYSICPEMPNGGPEIPWSPQEVILHGLTELLLHQSFGLSDPPSYVLLGQSVPISWLRILRR